MQQYNIAVLQGTLAHTETSLPFTKETAEGYYVTVCGRVPCKASEEPTWHIGELKPQELLLFQEYCNGIEEDFGEGSVLEVCVSLEKRPEWEYFEPYLYGLWIRKDMPRQDLEMLRIQLGIDSIASNDGDIDLNKPGAEQLQFYCCVANAIRKLRNKPNIIKKYNGTPETLTSFLMNLDNILSKSDATEFAWQRTFGFDDLIESTNTTDATVSAESFDNVAESCENLIAGVSTPTEIDADIDVEKLKAREDRGRWVYERRQENDKISDKQIGKEYESLTGISLSASSVARDVKNYHLKHEGVPAPKRKVGRKEKQADQASRKIKPITQN